MRWIDLAHRWTGGFVGLLLALLGASGAILVHRRAWVGLPHVADAQQQATDRIAAVTARIMADPATRPRSLTFAERDFGLDRLAYRGGAGAYADQAGTIVARWPNQWQRPEIWLFDLHRHLFAGAVGETIVGIAALAGIGFVATGTILWWRTRRTFAFRLWPKRLSRPAIVRHHRDLGIVMAPLLLLSLGTGALLVFRPLTMVVFGPGAPAAIAASRKPPPRHVTRLDPGFDWAATIRIARARFPDAEVRSIALPRGRDGYVTIRLRRAGEWLLGGRTTLWFAADSGRLAGVADALAAPRAARAYNLLFPLHAAEVGGLAYRLAMTVSGVVLTLLGTLTVWTFWFRRPRAQPRGRSVRSNSASIACQPRSADAAS